MWSKISNALKPREGNDGDPDHSDAQSIARHPPPDPFCANATTYYTQQTPPTPPPGAHSRTASREEDIIWSLRTQLALQRELCAQFEIDLAARDELVEALTIRLEAAEKENARHKSVVRSWKKKAGDLEKICRHLEEEVDNSRQESMERCIMDTASGEALRQLHQQISQLEREKSDVETERNTLTQAVDRAGAEISQLEREKNDIEAERNSLARMVENTEADITRLREKIGTTDTASAEVVHEQQHRISQLEREKIDVERERNDFSSEVSRLRVHIQQLQKDSAAMEVTIVQLNKQLGQDKEDIAGLNIALESKQQELELVKRKHGARGIAGSTTGRTSTAPSTAGKPAGIGDPASKVLRISTVGAHTSGAPSALGRVVNTKPPVTAALRRASTSSVEFKTKFPNRRTSVTSTPSEADEKENTSTPIPLKNPRRAMVPA